MKKFTKENWFKILIGLFLLFICIFLIYYFLFFIPLNRKIEDQRKVADYNLVQNQKCADDGLIYFNNYKKDLESKTKSNVSGTAEYHFNNTLKTCLVKMAFPDSKESIYLIKDIYSNKIIISSYMTFQIQNAIAITNFPFPNEIPYSDYTTQADKLMSE